MFYGECGLLWTGRQFPVVAVETDMPIINPMTGLQYGQLTVVLAMGSLAQISAYQRTKAGSASAVAVAERPTNYLERCLFSQSFVYNQFKFCLSFNHSVSERNVLQFVKSVTENIVNFIDVMCITPVATGFIVLRYHMASDEQADRTTTTVDTGTVSVHSFVI